MTLPLTVFLVTGVLFGLLTFSHRHHFSEGSTRRPGEADNTLAARLGWVALSTMLWPVLALSGVYGLTQRKRVPPRR